MKPGLTPIDALRDRRLFGALPEFRDLRTWSRWLVFLKAVFGLPLDEAELWDLQAAHGTHGAASAAFARRSSAPCSSSWR
jgi:hypothetical protein